MDPEFPTIHTFAIRRKGQRLPSVIGKLVRLSPSTVVLYRNFDKDKAAFRNLAGSLSFDERLFWAARGRAQWIDYVASGKLYRVDFETFIDRAIPQNNGEGNQLYLPLDQWTLVEGRPYRTSWRQEIDQILYDAPKKPWVPTTPVKPPEPPAPGPQGALL